MSCQDIPVIVPAAGIGSRMAADRPKQYLMLQGKTMLEVTIEKLLSHPRISNVIVAIHPNDSVFQTLTVAQSPRVQSVIGGEQRVDSVLAGLSAMSVDASWVLVHDAARPCFHLDDLSQLLVLTEDKNTHCDGGILAMPVIDTMKKAIADEDTVDCTVDRQGLWHALTPQLFRKQALIASIKAAQVNKVVVTDEASAMEANGGVVKLVDSRRCNIKVTQPEDLQLAEFYLEQERSV